MAEKKVVTQEEFNKRADEVALVALKLIEKMDTNKGEMGIVIKSRTGKKYQLETSQDVSPPNITFSPEHLRIISKGK